MWKGSMVHKSAGLPEAVFLDWDGTLVDSYDFLFAAHNHVREKMAMPPWTHGDFAEVIPLSTRDAYAGLYKDEAQKAQDILYRYVAENHLDALKVSQGAEDLLRALRQRGIRSGVISNKRHDNLVREIDALGWQGYFGIVIGAGQTARDKPAPDPLLHACRESGIAPHAENVWYAGDMETDLRCAAGAGCASIFMLHGMGSKDLVAKYKPYRVFESCVEAADYIMEK